MKKIIIIVLILLALIIGLVALLVYGDEGSQGDKLNQIPDAMRNCMKEKLGDDVYNRIESGDAERMKDINNNDVQSAIVFCAAQLKPVALPVR